MTQPGRELKAKLTTLMCKHNVRPIARAPIPLLSPTAGPQVLEGYAATPDVDAERMSFKRGALTWPGDLSKLPLLVRHDTSRVAGRILDLDYDVDGRLFIRARVDDPEARFSARKRLSRSRLCAGTSGDGNRGHRQSLMIPKCTHPKSCARWLRPPRMARSKRPTASGA
jgi:hypothetical protein